LYRERLLAAGADGETLAGIDREAREAVDRATEEAREAPFPDPDTLEIELWADGGSAWRN
jgi:acetoin:2,6-dichlorophenolindophenol oxidoreductase subunit alpha